MKIIIVIGSGLKIYRKEVRDVVFFATSLFNMTELQREYIKQRNRVDGIVDRLLFKGYVDTGNVIPPVKRATKKSIEELKSLNYNNIRPKMEFIMPTGEIVSGTAGSSFLGRQAYEKGRAKKEGRIIYEKQNISEIDMGNYYYEEFLDRVYENSPDHLYQMIREYIELIEDEKYIIGYGLSRMPRWVIDYFTGIKGESETAMEQFRSDVVKYLPIRKEKKEMLEQVFDEYQGV